MLLFFFFPRCKILHLLLLDLMMIVTVISPASSIFRSLWIADLQHIDLPQAWCCPEACWKCTPSYYPRPWNIKEYWFHYWSLRIGLIPQSISWSMKSGTMVVAYSSASGVLLSIIKLFWFDEFSEKFYSCHPIMKTSIKKSRSQGSRIFQMHTLLPGRTFENEKDSTSKSWIPEQPREL